MCDDAFQFLQQEIAETSRTSKKEQPKREGLAIELARATIASPPYHEGSPHDVYKYIKDRRLEQSVLSIIDAEYYWTFPVPRTILQDKVVHP